VEREGESTVILSVGDSCSVGDLKQRLFECENIPESFGLRYGPKLLRNPNAKLSHIAYVAGGHINLRSVLPHDYWKHRIKTLNVFRVPSEPF